MGEAWPSLSAEPTLAELQTYVADMVVARGFDGETIAERFMLLLEECGELARAARKLTNIKIADDTHAADLQDEAADVFILLLVVCNQLGVDLEAAFRAKEAKNHKRTWK